MGSAMTSAKLGGYGLLLSVSLFSAQPAHGQVENQRVVLSNGSALTLESGQIAVSLSFGGEERTLVETQSAFLLLDSISNPEGNVVGASIIENWDDGFYVSVFLESQGGVTLLAAFEAPSRNVAISDWDRDGDLDIGVPAPSDLGDLFLEKATDLVVYEQTDGRILRSSISCFPVLKTYMRNAVASIEGDFRTFSANSKPMWLGRSELTVQDMRRVPEFVGQLRSSIEHECERVAVDSQ